MLPLSASLRQYFAYKLRLANYKINNYNLHPHNGNAAPMVCKLICER